MPPLAPLRVADFMRARPAVLPEATPATEGAVWMHRHQQRHVFVCDDDGRLCGLVNRARLLRHLVARRLSGGIVREVPISELIVRDLVAVAPDDPLAHALGLMFRHRIGSLPVVDAEGQLVGLLSERMLLGVAEAVLADLPVGALAPLPASPDPSVRSDG